MNILINYAKNGESGPAFSLELAKGFLQNGHNVFAVLRTDINNHMDWAELLPARHIYWIKKGATMPSKIIAFLKFVSIDSLKIMFRFSGLIDISLRTFYSRNAAYIDFLIKPKKVVSLCHDPIPHTGANLDQKKYRRFYNKSDEIFVLTPSFVFTAATEFSMDHRHVHYIPHGRMNMYCKTSNYEAIKKDYVRKYHILYFGRIEKYKGLHILAKAYEILLSQYTDIELTILGSGNFDEYRNAFSSLQNVHLVNRYINDNEVGNYFSLPNTIAVVPYTEATQSGVIPIAYEFGTPIVVSNVGGLKEQLNHGKIGLLYENNDPSALANCILKLIHDPNEFTKQTALMLEYREKIEWHSVAKCLLDQIEK